jgi:cysteinyl-tRNA synthetase
MRPQQVHKAPFSSAARNECEHEARRHNIGQQSKHTDVPAHAPSFMNSLRIYNTLARDKQAFVPLRAGEVRMYVCGMTVYDYCHVGHARVLVVFDVVQRWLRTLGYRVTYVRNITDIDDKIIRRAVENGEPIKALTQRFIDALHEDSDALGVARPDLEPRATDFVPQMLGMIQTLEQNGYAYQATDGDVNLRTA